MYDNYPNPEAVQKKIPVKEFIKDMNLRTIYYPKDKDIYITSAEVNRPGVQIAGFFDVFNYERVQVLGVTEWTFLNSRSHKTQVKILDKLMSYEIPLFIVSTDQKGGEMTLEMARKYERPLAVSSLNTTKLVSKITTYLSEAFAPEITVHGVLVDVDGVGVFITGESGVGKSETALELIRRNHRLVADDAVKIKKIDEDTISGTAPEMLKYFIEVRGLGILDIKSLYGVGSVRTSCKIDMMVHLENWNEDKYYDRLGLKNEYEKILGIDIERYTIPVRPGRNIAIIIELAARNHRQKLMGYNPAKAFEKRLDFALGKKDD